MFIKKSKHYNYTSKTWYLWGQYKKIIFKVSCAVKVAIVRFHQKYKKDNKDMGLQVCRKYMHYKLTTY